ncbi:hypothetical protein FB451DRAFT_5225 [Mycena latifolia]|nr:hypothetical protein FB451DRAFT_5225 [Mycena latifolia]
MKKDTNVKVFCAHVFAIDPYLSPSPTTSTTMVRMTSPCVNYVFEGLSLDHYHTLYDVRGDANVSDVRDRILLQHKLPAGSIRLYRVDLHSSRIIEDEAITVPPGTTACSLASIPGLYPAGIPADTLHFVARKIAQVNAAEAEETPRQSNPQDDDGGEAQGAPLVAELPASVYSRPGTVQAIYAQTIGKGFVHVEGTPRSGKTTLLRLLYKHIVQQDPQALVLTFSGWPSFIEAQTQFLNIVGYFSTRCSGPALSYQQVYSWVGEQRLWLLFDDGQAMFWDEGLWNGLFKSLEPSKNLKVVMFSTLPAGLADSTVARQAEAARHFRRSEHPFVVSYSARVGERPTVTVPHALCLSAGEFSAFIDHWHDTDKATCASIDMGLAALVYQFTAGHLGSICALLNFVGAAWRKEEFTDEGREEFTQEDFWNAVYAVPRSERDQQFRGLPAEVRDRAANHD